MELCTDGTGRIAVQKGKNQPELETVVVAAATTRALGDISPEEADPVAAVFGLTAEALRNRVRAGGPGRRPRGRVQRPHRHSLTDGGSGSA